MQSLQKNDENLFISNSTMCLSMMPSVGLTLMVWVWSINMFIFSDACLSLPLQIHQTPHIIHPEQPFINDNLKLLRLVVITNLSSTALAWSFPFIPLNTKNNTNAYKSNGMETGKW